MPAAIAPEALITAGQGIETTLDVPTWQELPILETGNVPRTGGRSDGNGILYNNSNTKMRDVVDGTSNTLMVGEVTGRLDRLI